MTLLLRAVAGSYLYGTNHAGSDQDFYEVWDKLPYIPGVHPTKTRQTIVNGVDTIQSCLSRWTHNLEKSHQALDSCFTPDDLCEVDLISDFRHTFRTGVSAIHAFERVIRSFSFPDTTNKQKMHAVRLQWCIDEMMYTGRYNPRVTGERRDQLMRML